MAADRAARPRLPLVDHHCHGVVRGELDSAAFEAYLTESDAPAAPGTSYFDTQLGFAVRRWCPPLLGLAPHCPPEPYLARRRELGAAEATRRLLRAAGVTDFLVDTGLPGDLTSPQELAEAAGGAAREIVRLEHLAERVADTSRTADSFLAALGDAVRAAARASPSSPPPSARRGCATRSSSA
ncbi:amidohydrolase, partial [Streptomyces sp. NPDC005970]